MALDHLHKLEATALAEYEEIKEEWKAQPIDERGEKPEPPRRLIVSDITTEGLLAVHAKAPLGLLLSRDELAGWIRGFDQYKGGKGSDAQTWTEMHQGNPCIIDRKGSSTLSVPRAAVSIIGGVQPELLRNALCGEHLYNGVASRILFIAVPEKPKRWSDKRASRETKDNWDALLDELLALEPNGDGTPIDLCMTKEAKAALVKYYDEHAQREAEEDGPLRAAMSKLEATTARLALVIQLADDPQSRHIKAKAIKAGITISNWFEGQARRVYRGFEETEQERDRRALCDWIASRGGETTRRDLARNGLSQFRRRAKKVLADLVAAGLAKVSRQAGQRAEKYVLCDSDSCDGETP